MFFLGTIRRWFRDRGRLLFSFYDGRQYRRADPLAIGRALEQVDPDYISLLAAVHDDPNKMPPGVIRDDLRRQQNEAAVKLAKLARTVFGLAVPSGPVLKDGELTDGEALGILTQYFLFMEELAEAAGFTSTPPGAESSPPAVFPTAP